MNELIPHLTVFLLVLVRVSAFFVTVPFFSYRTIPPQVKITLALVLAWMMYYTIDVEPFAFNDEYILLVMKEALVGLLLGLVGYIIMSAIQIAGSFIDFQMGFAIANIIDPQTGAQSPLIGQFFNMLAFLLLLAINGHHMILDGIYYSYQFLPMDQFPSFTNEGFPQFIITTFTAVFAIAFQMAAPVVATLFLVDLALGITAKTVPQLNIFVVGFPIKIAVSFLVLFTMMAVMIQVIQKLITIMIYGMRDLMAILGGG
ncbi:flagellar type III secretion system protein FliR [Lysinibacillus fusiformis]|jgi:flagellar biosynthetic protein FliR|uniref:Flagellar biosynthetic protein FliR n=1 Tax=Lysinibacillus fusiformis TaxID=28031 RepID=A0A1H9D4J8_9BACI|nr:MULTISPECIES: flagellar biosynthetic protein FliR [Lysinibacillus]EAZ83831.1 flagellar biosynthesis protein R [Bacillus sp. B14905]HAU34059.1 flagellar type III secretion system protein FliR [Lysinibacillus sp.]AJK88972.1 flagellar biosynthesis protein FliR [Lysinibacillus fusiformis]KAB0441835.1 flagellar biosynthetic protein FliR [Lysinibacillus fusiformis]KEK09642.1 flagellar biosynthesis protein FliR [Lysinibacillus sphaericus]